ncbi:hypothetical protein DVDV_4031 [Desulfovibrio sp. DV]|nr:hypothetical protein DVDV_4031 [Desulfovibrio sp. DV]
MQPFCFGDAPRKIMVAGYRRTAPRARPPRATITSCGNSCSDSNR